MLSRCPNAGKEQKLAVNACASHPFRLSLRLALLSTRLRPVYGLVHGLIDQDISRIRLLRYVGRWQNP